MGKSQVQIYDVNSGLSIASAVFLGTVGVLSFIIQPGIVQGFVTNLHMTEGHANDVVGVEMMGVALATILVAALGERIDWRRLLAAALAIGIAGDLASAVMTDNALLPAARFLAGLGHGAVISLSFTFVGLTVRPDRNIAFYLAALLSYGAVGLWSLPSLLNAVGFQPLFLFFAAVTALGFLTVNHVPRSSQHREEVSPTAVQLSPRVIIVGLAGVLAYNIAQGIAWANLALIGGAAHMADQAVANDLFLSQLVAVAGALLSVVLAGMGRRALMIGIGVIGGALFIALLIGQPSPLLFLIAVCGFNFLWNFVLPFILSAVGDLDLHGRVMSPAIAMQMIGLGLGPILSGRLIQAGGFTRVEMVCVGFFVLSLALLAGPLAAHRRRLVLRDAALA